MYKINFKEPIHVHFIGIGGISMSGLAEVLIKEQFQISGSDAKESLLTQKLEAMGARIFYGQRASNIVEGTELVVYTAAIRGDNLEYQRAVEQNIPMISRAELLGQMMCNYETSIAVAGTHGKTTTTSMISQILLQADVDPTISVGGILKAIDGNIRVGNSEIFLTEACEYTNSFLNFNPKISIILNVEEDHLDFFRDLEHIRQSFRLFAERVPKDGVLIINGDIKNYEYFTENLECKVVTYGLKEKGNYNAQEIQFDELARGTFTLLVDGEVTDRFSLGVPGEHNVSNGLASIALARELGITKENIQQGLLSFLGTDRRFEYKGEIGGITIIDDYAHHPTEIYATLTTAKNYPNKNIYCVFQPHTFTRTKAFLKEFALALGEADCVILTDIYPARETDNLGISSKDLLNELEKLGKKSYYFGSFDEVENFLLEKCMHGDLLITMGAGDIQKVGESILGK